MAENMVVAMQSDSEAERAPFIQWDGCCGQVMHKLLRCGVSYIGVLVPVGCLLREATIH